MSESQAGPCHNRSATCNSRSETGALGFLCAAGEVWSPVQLEDKATDSLPNSPSQLFRVDVYGRGDVQTAPSGPALPRSSQMSGRYELSGILGYIPSVTQEDVCTLGCLEHTLLYSSTAWSLHMTGISWRLKRTSHLTVECSEYLPLGSRALFANQ